MSIKKSTFKILSVLLMVIIYTGCSMSSIYKRKGLELINSGKYDDAIVHYENLLKNDPGNSSAKTLLLRAKMYSYYYHLALARKIRDNKKHEAAIKEYKRALMIFPDNELLKKELINYLDMNKPKVKHDFSTSIKAPVQLSIDGEKIDILSLKNIPVKKIFKIIGKSYKVNFIFDKDFRDFPYTFEVENIGFYEALKMLCLISNTSYRVVDKNSVLIYPNTSFKKRIFDLKGVKVFFLSNISGEDAKKLIIPMFRDQQILIQEDSNLNSLVVKATKNVLIEIEKFISKIDRAKSEVEFDIEILEVNRNVLNKIGTEFGNTFSTLKIGEVGEDGSLDSTLNVNNLKNSNFFLTLPSVALNLLGTDDNSKILAKPNLRGINGEDIKFMVGDELPIPQTTLQSVAAGGVESIPLTTYQYKNVGVEIKLTPFVHKKGEVTLKLKLTMNFVTTYVDQFPVMGKRELENTIRLKEGESSIIGGFIRDEVRGKLKGLPWLSKIPVLGRLFGSRESTIRQKDIIFSITPKFIRSVDISKESEETIWSESEDHSSTGNIKKTQRPNNLRSLSRITGDSVSISPSGRSVRVNTSALFSININTEKNISTLSLSGSVSGEKAEIEELSTSVIKNEKIKILKNNTETNFDLGYSFFDSPIKHGNIARLKIKFLKKGKYTISINNLRGSANRETVNLKAVNATVTVF
ncbi:MAG: FecR domain-containing protein [Acidobacteriota bacterium]